MKFGLIVSLVQENNGFWLEAFLAWLKSAETKVLKKSSLGKAIAFVSAIGSC